MISQTFFYFSKNGTNLIPSLGTRVSRCYSSNNSNSKSSSSCEDKKNGKGDKFALSKELENGINDQINNGLKSAYAQIAMAEYYNRRNVGLPGFAKDHGSKIKQEFLQVKKMVKILSQRGGNLTLKPVDPPANQDWKTPVDVEKFAVQLKKDTALGLMGLQSAASKVQDYHVSSVIGSALTDQMKSMFGLEQRLSKLEHCSKPECLLALDGALLKSKKPKKGKK